MTMMRKMTRGYKRGGGVKKTTTKNTSTQEKEKPGIIKRTIGKVRKKFIPTFDEQFKKARDEKKSKFTSTRDDTKKGKLEYSTMTKPEVEKKIAKSKTADTKARAGKGILNRSGIVGTWFSEVKHEIEYQPIFYGSDSSCEKELDSDEFGEYTLGTIIWNDNTRTESVYLLTNPADNFAYTASQVHFALTYAPIDQATLKKIDRQVARELGNAKPDSFLDRMNEENPSLTTRYIIFNKVSDHCKNVLSERKAAAVFDDICRDDIQPSYFEMYDGISEQTFLQTNITAVEQDVLDYCGINNPTINPVLEGAEQAASTSDVLPTEYYKQFISNPDSLMNRLKNGFDIVEKARPKNKVDRLPPQIVGEDQSGRVFTKKSFRDLPPRTDRVGYFCNDLVITDDKYLNPILDLDPQTTINQPKIIVRSRPKWTASNTGQTWPITVTTPAGPLTTSMSVTVNNSETTTNDVTMQDWVENTCKIAEMTYSLSTN